MSKVTPSRPESVIYGRDPQVLETLLCFYACKHPRIVDLTAGERRMWKGLVGWDVTYCDIDPKVHADQYCDFRRTQLAPDWFDVVVFDPPHLPRAAASPKSDQDFARRYGLGRSTGGDNVDSVYRPALAEIARILKPEGMLFAKLCDYVHNHRYQWSLVAFVEAVRATLGLTACDLIIKRDPAQGNLKSGRWTSTYHTRRCHSWWVVVRKGGCEPKKRTTK